MPFPHSPSRPRLVVHRNAATPGEPDPPRARAAQVAPQLPGLASLTVDGLPPALFERIVESAAANHRSIVGEVIARLEAALGSSRPPSDSMLARVRAIRSRLGAAPSAVPLARPMCGFSFAGRARDVARGVNEAIAAARKDPGAS